MKRNLRYLIVGLPFLPLLIVLIPESFCVPLDPERPCPWYAVFTTLPVVFSAQILAPATLLAGFLGASAMSATWWCVCLLYASLLSCGIHLVLKRSQNRRTKGRAGDL